MIYLLNHFNKEKILYKLSEESYSIRELISNMDKKEYYRVSKRHNSIKIIFFLKEQSQILTEEEYLTLLLVENDIKITDGV